MSERTPEQEAAIDKLTYDMAELTEELVTLICKVRDRMKEERDAGVTDEEIVTAAMYYWLPVIYSARVMMAVSGNQSDTDRSCKFIREVSNAYTENGFNAE